MNKRNYLQKSESFELVTPVRIYFATQEGMKVSDVPFGDLKCLQEERRKKDRNCIIVGSGKVSVILETNYEKRISLFFFLLQFCMAGRHALSVKEVSSAHSERWNRYKRQSKRNKYLSCQQSNKNGFLHSCICGKKGERYKGRRIENYLYSYEFRHVNMWV